jgi:uncharacterized protein (TIGR01244 family)
MTVNQTSYFRSLGRLVLSLIVLGCPVSGFAQLMNEAEPVPGITTAGQPTASQLEQLAEQGYVAVIDLRGANEDRGFDEAGKVEELGMHYVSLPISGPDTISNENAEVLDTLLNEIDGPVLLHCASSNRVGALLSLRQSLLGVDDEAAMDIGIAAGMSSPVLKDRVESLLSER